jgi:type VI secretion system protein VasI
MKPIANNFIIFFLAFAFSHTGIAAEQRTIENKEMLKCAAINNSIDRLSCFDELAKKLGPPVAINSVPKTAGEWSTSTEKSKFDDSKSVFLTLNAKETITGWPGKIYKPSLVIRCKENQTQAYIIFGMSAAVEYGLYNKSTLQFRIDKKKSFKLAASKSTDGEALFLPNAINFAKKIMNAEELLVRFVPFNSPPQETSFHVTGLNQAIKQLREACKW